MPPDWQEMIVKRRNITTVVDPEEEEKDCDREVEECETIEEDKKDNNAYLKAKNIFADYLMMLFG